MSRSSILHKNALRNIAGELGVGISMDDTLKTVLAIWGASLSTTLAIKTLVSAVRVKLKIKVSAELIYLACNEDDQTKGTKVYIDRGGWSKVRIGVKASNPGAKSIQIVSVYINEEKSSHQIFPENIPVVLEPRTQLQTTIQKEWLDNSRVVELGVLDALGKRHSIGGVELEELIGKSNALPSNKKKYRNKETGEEVEAFQVADPSSLNSRMN
jgi:hypothetical protein